MMLTAPPPWTLTGEGVILLYRFPRPFVEREGAIPPALEGCYAGGLGAVMVVDYATSNVGAYQELLFIPGTFRDPTNPRKRFYSITRILVSSQESVTAGRENWAIPKQQADFTISHTASAKMMTVTVTQAGRPLAAITVEGSRGGIPLTTGLIPPAMRTLLQPLNGAWFYTAPAAWGRLRPARLRQFETAEGLFPNVAQFRPLIVLRASAVRLTFPIPKQRELFQHSPLSQDRQMGDNRGQ